MKGGPMSASTILVAYASNYGSTREIAETIGKTLKEDKHNVEIQLLRDVKSLEAYSSAMIGAPLYMFHWHKEALRFLGLHQKAFEAGFPLAIFAGGPFGQADDKIWREVRESLDKELLKFPKIKPVSIQIMGGNFEPAKLRFPYSLIPALKKMPASDLRDWDAIRKWAKETGKILS